MEAIQTTDILGVHISVTDMDRALAAVEANRESWKGRYICACNVHTTVTAQDDPALKAAENGAVLVLPDGGPLSFVQRRRGFHDAARVTGPDFMLAVLRRSGERGYRHFFFGSSPETLAAMQKAAMEQFPGAAVVGAVSPPFRPFTEAENEAYAETINASGADFLWVGLGAPRQEIWMAENASRVRAISVGVGAAFDMLAGNVKRAPAWMQKCCLEWLYRLLQEPRRLFKRYFVTNARFLWLLLKERGR